MSSEPGCVSAGGLIDPSSLAATSRAQLVVVGPSA